MTAGGLQHLMLCPRGPGRPSTAGLAATDRIVSASVITAAAVMRAWPAIATEGDRTEMSRADREHGTLPTMSLPSIARL